MDVLRWGGLWGKAAKWRNGVEEVIKVRGQSRFQEQRTRNREAKKMAGKLVLEEFSGAAALVQVRKINNSGTSLVLIQSLWLLPFTS